MNNISGKNGNGEVFTYNYPQNKKQIIANNTIVRSIIPSKCPIEDYHQECSICKHFKGIRRVRKGGTYYWVIDCRCKNKN